MTVNWDAAKFWLEVCELSGLVVLGIWAFWGRKHDGHRNKMRRIEERLRATETKGEQMALTIEQLEGDVADMVPALSKLHKIEATIEHMPTSQDFRVLCKRVGTVEGDLKAIKAGVDALKTSNDRILDYLMNKG